MIKSFSRIILVSGVSLFCLFMTVDRLHAQNSILNEIIRSQESIVDITAENYDVYASKPAIAGIDKSTGRILAARKVAQAAYKRGGAGVIIHGSGVIVTNAHVVHKANYIKVTLFNKTEVYAQVIKFAGDLDFCLLKIDPPFPLYPIEMANSDAINLGDEIITVGNSFLLDQTVSGGTVKGLGTSRTDKGKRVDLIHTSFNLYQGDSGGPLFDRKGRLLGLMTAGETGADHSSFAIPSNKIQIFFSEYLSGLTTK